MAKPICVIYYNPDMGVTAISHHEISAAMEVKMPDYHVFCVPSYKSIEGDAELVEFKVFYDKDFTDIQYLQLEKMIAESLPNYDPKDDIKGAL